MAGNITVRVLRSREEIEQIRPLWESWRHHPNSDIDFYLAIQGLKPSILRPHILLISRDGAPESILIGRIEKSAVECKIGYWTVFEPQARVLRLIYGGLLGHLSADASEMAVREIMSALRAGEADVASLNLIASDSPLCAASRKIAGGFSRDGSSAPQEHWNLTLGNDPEWQQGIARKLRKNQRWKKLVRDFSENLRIDWHRGPADLDRMTSDMEEIASKTYQRGLGAGFVNDEATRARLRFEAEKGWLRIYILYLAGQPCAFWSGSCYGDTFFSGDMGYDPANARYSPGMFLILTVMENFRHYQGNEDISRIDWGLGGAEYKEELSDNKWLESSFWIWAPTFKGARLKFGQAATTLVDRVGRNLLQGTTLMKAKRVWRNRLQRVRPTATGESERQKREVQTRPSEPRVETSCLPTVLTPSGRLGHEAERER